MTEICCLKRPLHTQRHEAAIGEGLADGGADEFGQRRASPPRRSGRSRRTPDPETAGAGVFRTVDAGMSREAVAETQRDADVEARQHLEILRLERRLHRHRERVPARHQRRRVFRDIEPVIGRQFERQRCPVPPAARRQKADGRDLGVKRVADRIKRMVVTVRGDAKRNDDPAGHQRHVAAAGDFAGEVAVAQIGAEARAIDLDALRIDEDP